MTDDLKERIRQAAEALKEIGAQEVYVFGSAAHGVMRADSDVDLAVVGLPPERFLEAMGRASRVLRRPVDLVDMDEVNPFTDYLRRKGALLRVA